MTGAFEEQELKDRLSLIETMIAEGRQTTERWGWSFVLWGVAYYAAIVWSAWGRSNLAWPVTMIAASVLTVVVARRLARRRASKALGRTLSWVWMGMGISLFVLMFSLAYSGRLDLHVSCAIIGAMLGMANATSSFILRWKMQFGCALMWWATAVAACFVSDSACMITFLVAIFICQIVFGIYGMIADARLRKPGAAHA